MTMEGKKTAQEVKLHPFETFTYLTVWVSAVCYSIYRVYDVGKYFKHDTYNEDFTEGWIGSGSRRDMSDYEWEVWLPLILKMLPWFFVQLIGSELCRWFNLQILPVWYIMLSNAFLLYEFGWIPALVLYVQPIIFSSIARVTYHKSVTWIIALAVLFLINMSALKSWFSLPDQSNYLLTLCQSWLYLRCMSYCLEVQSGSVMSPFLHFVAYCFYLPTFILGPLILFPEFYLAMKKPFTMWTFKRLGIFIFGMCRYLFWMFVMELWLHNIYSNALSFQSSIVWNLDSWTLYGLGYCLGQYFMIKYTVVYGLAGVLAAAEGYPAPSPPKCIGRIHLYSDMWRTFDQGLYFFLCRYIYLPTVKSKNGMCIKFLASFLCFCFVYFWHGTMLYIFIWSALNFVGVITEAIARHINFMPAVQRFQNKWLSERNKLRLHALLASPLLFMSALSNFYFFAGRKTGNVFVGRAFQGWSSSSLVVLCFLYCCCHVSAELKLWQQNQLTKNKQA